MLKQLDMHLICTKGDQPNPSIQPHLRDSSIVQLHPTRPLNLTLATAFLPRLESSRVVETVTLVLPSRREVDQATACGGVSSSHLVSAMRGAPPTT
jgi:hypothetical protein